MVVVIRSWRTPQVRLEGVSEDDRVRGVFFVCVLEGFVACVNEREREGKNISLSLLDCVSYWKKRMT